MDVDIAPFDLGARLTEVRQLARAAMSAAGQPGGMLIANYLDEVTGLPDLLALGAHRTGPHQRGELAGVLVGWSTASREWWPNQVRPALAVSKNLHWLEDAFELAELHVHPEAQGRGIATALLAETERRVPQGRIVLSTNAIGNQHARNFYRRRGFRVLTGPFEWRSAAIRIFVLGRELTAR